MLLVRIIIIICCILSNLFVFGQELPAIVEPSSPVKHKTQKDSIKERLRFNTLTPIPKRAGLYSALLPGLGQVYNKQFWKTGIVIAGFGAITGFMVFNVRKYRYYHNIYIGRIDTDPTTFDTLSFYSNEDINTLRRGYRRYTEYTAIAASVGYLLNIIDAFTAAHLRTFDRSKDLSFQISPTFTNRQLGLCITYSF
jgi:hypothetical protein